jgi:hypothetical protein
MDQAPVQVGQFILGKNLGIGAFGKVRRCLAGVTVRFRLDTLVELVERHSMSAHRLGC